jgi:glycosyltransferase involved in cell wall biosynthesis
MKILHLIDSLDYSGSARQLHLLGPALANTTTAVEICCLGSESPWSASLRQAGVIVHALGWTRLFDLNALWNLREILGNMAPDVIHVWRLPALRILAVVAKEMLPRVVMSAPLPATGKLAWWDRRLLQHVRCLAVAGVSDRLRCLQHGIARAALHVVPPAVVSEEAPDTLPMMHEPRQAIVCVGKLEREEGARQAIWAFDMLLQLFPQAQLQLVGAGSQEPVLRALVQGLRNAANVHFLGAAIDAAHVLRAAEVVWIPSQANCGRQVALEAMASGRAVIASDVPCLREVLRDGETGFLVPAGDVVARARRTRLLFHEERLCARIGAAARQYVQRQFSRSDAVECWREVYSSAAA